MGLTQKKGNLGLVKVITDLTEKDISVSLPISESEKYDLIVEKNNICKTVQVKYSKIYKGSIAIKLKSIWTNSKGRQTRNRKKGDYDVIAIYCPDTNGVYYVRDKDFKNTNYLFLRVNEPMRNKDRCKMANDYKKFNW